MNRRSVVIRALFTIMVVAIAASPQGNVSATTTRQMQRELDQIGADVDRFWAQVSSNYDLPYYAPGVDFQIGEFESGCGRGGEYAIYCGIDEVIYLDPAILAAEYDRTGGNGIAIATVSHEWGHHLTFLWLAQAEGQVDYTWLLDREVRWELLADCLSGVYMGAAWADAPPADGQLLAVVRDYSNIGSRVHGTGDERVVAFMSGYVEGFEGCDFLD